MKSFVNMLKVIAASLCMLIIFSELEAGCMALEMNEKLISNFKREVVRTLAELMPYAVNTAATHLDVRLRDAQVRNMRVHSLELTMEGVTKKLKERLAFKEVDFDELSRTISVNADIEINPEDMKAFIYNEIARQAYDKRPIKNLEISFENGKIRVSGIIDIVKIPGNPLAFLPLTTEAPFSAEIAPKIDGDCIIVDILNATLNGVELVPPLSTQVLEFLNPLMDFSALSCPAGISRLEITPQKISISGYLFDR